MIEVTYILNDVENTMIIDREEFVTWWLPYVEVIYVRHIKKATAAAA